MIKTGKIAKMTSITVIILYLCPQEGSKVAFQKLIKYSKRGGSCKDGNWILFKEDGVTVDLVGRQCPNKC